MWKMYPQGFFSCSIITFYWNCETVTLHYVFLGHFTLFGIFIYLLVQHNLFYVQVSGYDSYPRNTFHRSKLSLHDNGIVTFQLKSEFYFYKNRINHFSVSAKENLLPWKYIKILIYIYMLFLVFRFFQQNLCSI